MLMSIFRNRIRTSTIKGLFQSIGWFPLLGSIINIMNYNHNLSFILKKCTQKTGKYQSVLYMVRPTVILLKIFFSCMCIFWICFLAYAHYII